MSRAYAMEVEVSEFDKAKQPAIEDAAGLEWVFEDWNIYRDVLHAYGEASLCGGETEEHFTARLTHAIWKANGAFCKVEVRATCLENLPCDSHSLDENDYKAAKESGSLTVEEE